MRKPIIAGNWKMNKLPCEGAELVEALKAKVADAKCDVKWKNKPQSSERLTTNPAILSIRLNEEQQCSDGRKSQTRFFCPFCLGKSGK